MDRSTGRSGAALVVSTAVARQEQRPWALAPALQFEGRNRRINGVLVAVFVASGAAGLMYQVVWARQLVLIFGNTSEAIGTIVTAFMAGLGLGGLVAGLAAPRLRRPLRVYAAVELGIALLALLVPLELQLIEGAYASVYDTSSPQVLTLMRLLMTLAAITPVTFLMGLTLPLLTRHMVTTLRTAGAHMGRLYAANTFGAMLGTLVAGFVLIELLGLLETARVAVGLNVLAAAAAMAVSLRVSDSSIEPRLTGAEDGTPGPPVHSGVRLLLYAATFVSGFVALALEVLWTRMLAEGTGSRIYIFVMILAIYLLGIALGGAVYRWRSDPGRDTPRALAVAFAGIALCTVATVPLVTFWITTANISRALVLLPATVLMGYAFPLTARLLSRDPAHSSRSIGVLYAWNTLGSLLGSLAAAFVLAATLGTNASVLVLGAADAAVALMLVLATTSAAVAVRRRATLGAAALVVAPTVLVATGSPVLLTATEHRIAAMGLPDHHSEDRISTVDAVGGPVYKRRLYVTGTAMTALSVDTKLMAYIPKVMRPGAQSMLDICFGMGTTFRSALRLGLRTDAVDLSPSVPWQMPVFYPDANQYLHSPRARIITADGRNYVRLTSHRYDLVTVDPPPPIESAGTVVLYTREFYADVHRVLKPGGLMLQWLYFGVDLEQLREHLRTFRAAFPHMVVLISPRHGGMYMLGSDEPISWTDGTTASVMETPEARADLASAPDAPYLPQLSWSAIVDHMLWLRDRDVDRFVGDGPMITDDHPLTEYYILHSLFSPHAGHIVNELMLRRLWPVP